MVSKVHLVDSPIWMTLQSPFAKLESGGYDWTYGGSESSGSLLGEDGFARLSSGDVGKVSTTSGGAGMVDSLVFRICLRLRLYCVSPTFTM